MNDPDDQLSDELLDEALAPLRSVVLPDETHKANMAAVHQALAQRVRPRWWRQSVPIPAPVCVAATVALAVATIMSLKPSAVPDRIQQEAIGTAKAEFVDSGTVPSDGASNAAGPSWSITRSYIHSLASLANSEAISTSVAKEEQDDS